MLAYRTEFTDIAPDGEEIIMYPITRSDEVFFVGNQDHTTDLVQYGQTLTACLETLAQEVDYIRNKYTDSMAAIASAITEKGVPTNPTDSLETMQKNILSIKTGVLAQWK